MSVVSIYGERVLRQVDVTLSTVSKILKTSGLNVRLFDEYIAIDEPGLAMCITVAGDPSNKIWYSTSLDFKEQLPQRRRLQLANRINSRNVGTAYVNKSTLCVWSTLSFRGGILGDNIVNTLSDFRELLEGVLLEEVKGELDLD